MDSKPWWQSKTIWSALIAALCAGLSLAGHNIDAGTQAVLVTNITNILDGAAAIAGIIASICRASSTTTLTNGDKK